MNDATNPYQPPIDLTKTQIVADLNWHELPHGRLDFSFQLSRADVHRCVTPGPKWWFPIVLVLLTLMLAIAMILGRPVGRGLGLAGELLLIVGMIWLAYFSLIVIQRLVSRQAISQSPSVLESTTGYLTAHGIYDATEHQKGFCKWEDIKRITLNDRCVTMSSDNWRQIDTILPWSGFTDEASARAALESVSKQVSRHVSPALDERLRLPPDDEPMFHPTDPHVPFRGTVTIGQVINATPGKKLKRSISRVFILCTIAIAASMATSLLGAKYFMMAGVPICGFAIWMLIKVRRHPLNSADAETVAFRLEGWFTEHDYFLHTFAGQCLREYTGLQACSLDDAMISLRIPSSVDAWQFIPRSMFSSHEEFAQVCRWLQQAVTVASDTRGTD